MPVALRGFVRSESGNFSMMFAMLLPVMLGSVGLAVDVASMMRAHSQLQNATDAAVLAASRINDKTMTREKVFQDFLAANIADNSGLSNINADIDIDIGINYISTVGTVAADVDLHFAFLFGESRRISVESSAYESRDNLEVVMALDNTGSMGSARMAELRKAATSLVDILSLVHAPDGEPKRVVKAALVPFVTAVNIKGEGYSESWIDTKWDPVKKAYVPRGSRLALYHGAYFDKVSGQPVNHLALFDELGTTWKGCVEARPAAAPERYNLSDAAPDPLKPDTLFVPYFAPDNPGAAGQSPNSGTAWNNSYMTDSYGDKDAAKLRDSSRYKNAKNLYIRDNQSRTTGPNYACPTPIVPLTSDFAKLKTEIGKMIYWEGSGTNVSEGLAWSQRVLSPQEPYTQGAPFNSEYTSKFVVVFTDGENTVFGASSKSYNTSDYGSYSFLDQGRVHTNRNSALTQVNTWTLDACTSLKSQGVEVFTVLLGADTQANRTLYTKCATTPDHYYPTSDVTELDAVFKKIASRIARLYITN